MFINQFLVFKVKDSHLVKHSKNFTVLVKFSETCSEEFKANLLIINFNPKKGIGT